MRSIKAKAAFVAGIVLTLVAAVTTVHLDKPVMAQSSYGPAAAVSRFANVGAIAPGVSIDFDTPIFVKQKNGLFVIQAYMNYAASTSSTQTMGLVYRPYQANLTLLDVVTSVGFNGRGEATVYTTLDNSPDPVGTQYQFRLHMTTSAGTVSVPVVGRIEFVVTEF